MLEPSTPAEAAELMREQAAAGAHIAFAGGGTHTIGRPARGDVALSTLGLRSIVEYAPEDQTVTVEAGVTVAQLAGLLATRGQRLVLEVADPDRATIGGAIAANISGPRRMRFGSLKDLILGVSLVRADGVAARAGGKVVKNVAGFDLSKLLVGSHGTLALITAATLRVHPLPEASRALRFSALSPAMVWEAVIALRARQLEPAALVAQRRTGGPAYYDLDIIFEGFRSGVDAQSESCLACADERGWAAAHAASEDTQADDARIRAAGPLRVQCTTLPSEFAETDAGAIEPFSRTLVESSANAYPALGIFTVAGTPTPATPAAFASARAWIEGRGGSLIVETQPPASAGTPEFAPWGTPPPSFALMQRLKSRFDPDHRLAPGRFVGGL